MDRKKSSKDLLKAKLAEKRLSQAEKRDAAKKLFDSILKDEGGIFYLVIIFFFN